MATVWANATAIGSKNPSGQQNYVVTRGSTQAGDVTVAFDTVKVTTKGQLMTAAMAVIKSLQDQLK